MITSAATWAVIFFADGLFMVAAWIGMWYPLDMLVYYARPYRLETKALVQLTNATVVIESQPPTAPFDPIDRRLDPI